MPEPSRLVADRRAGVDRRAGPRRLRFLAVTMERRQLVDRRRGTERRSTLDRRGRAVRMRASESPSEHLRNALQLLAHVSGTAELTAAPRADFDAAMQRLEEALRTLERRASKTDRA